MGKNKSEEISRRCGLVKELSSDNPPEWLISREYTMLSKTGLAEKVKTPDSTSGEAGYAPTAKGRGRNTDSLLAGEGLNRLAADIWQDRIRLFPAIYRILVFIIAAIQVSFFSSVYYLAVPGYILVTAIGLYTLFRVLHPSRWQQGGALAYSLLGSDLVVCYFLLTVTGGLKSPFLLYTLAPVLCAAIYLDIRVTFGVATLFVAEDILGHVYNPFFSTTLSPSELNSFLIYIIAVGITAAVPYVVNVNVRQRVESESIQMERKRLSREIHDGIAQVLAGVRWQAQLVHRRLAERGVDTTEVTELITLLTRGEQDAREYMELLRSYTGGGAFLHFIKDYLEHLKRDSAITYQLDIETEKLNLEPVVELQLLRICQEALTNVRKHSGAHHVQVSVKMVDSHLLVSIADDGRGFDVYSQRAGGLDGHGRGLAVMRERAESIGGRLWVVSLPGQGTEIHVEVPCGLRRRWLWLVR